MSKKILLCCSAGMSTSLLVTKMQEEVAMRGLDIEIQALPISEGIDKVQESDLVLLGPQVGYARGNFEKVAADKVPVQVIPMVDYGRMNAKAVIDNALKAMG